MAVYWNFQIGSSNHEAPREMTEKEMREWAEDYIKSFPFEQPTPREIGEDYNLLQNVKNDLKKHENRIAFINDPRSKR